MVLMAEIINWDHGHAEQKKKNALSDFFFRAIIYGSKIYPDHVIGWKKHSIMRLYVKYFFIFIYKLIVFQFLWDFIIVYCALQNIIVVRSFFPNSSL
jgi:hypothetical protein